MASSKADTRPDGSSIIDVHEDPSILDTNEGAGEPVGLAQAELRQGLLRKDPIDHGLRAQVEEVGHPKITEDERSPTEFSTAYHVPSHLADTHYQEEQAQHTNQTSELIISSLKQVAVYDEAPVPYHTSDGLAEDDRKVRRDGNTIADSTLSQTEEPQELENAHMDRHIQDEGRTLSLGDAQIGTDGFVGYLAGLDGEQGESSQDRSTTFLINETTPRNTIDGEGAPTEIVSIDNSLPIAISPKSIVLKSRTRWVDRALIFVWFLCCLILVMATFYMARQLDWNGMSIITAVPIFNHPKGVLRFLAMPLSLSQAKGIDFAVSAVIAPLLIAYANYIWFRVGRRLSNPEPEVPVNMTAEPESFDAGTYDVGKLTEVLKSWTPRSILFALLLVSSALASTLLCNALAYKAIPGSKEDGTDENEMFYQMVYIPALLFLSLCSITTASIAALCLVFKARKAVFEQNEQRAATIATLTSEVSNSETNGAQRANSQSYFFLSLPKLPGYRLPAWRLPRGSNAKSLNHDTANSIRELEPLLPVSERVERGPVWKPFAFPRWRLFGARNKSRDDSANSERQGGAEVISNTTELEPSVSRHLNSAGQREPSKFRFWKFGSPSLPMTRSEQPMIRGVSAPATGSDGPENMADPESMSPTSPKPYSQSAPWSFQFWRLGFPGLRKATYGEHIIIAKPAKSAQGSVLEEVIIAEPSRSTGEPGRSDIRATESSPLLGHARSLNVLPRLVQKPKIWSFGGFGFPSMFWSRNAGGRGMHDDHADMVETSNSTDPERSSSNNVFKSTNTASSAAETHEPWQFPSLQMPHFTQSLQKQNIEDLESQIVYPLEKKGKDIQRDLPESSENILLPKQTSTWGMPHFWIPEFPTKDTSKDAPSSEVHHGISTFALRVDEENQQGVSQGSKQNDPSNVEWAVKWIDSNDSMETTNAFEPSPSGATPGSLWHSQQGAERKLEEANNKSRISTATSAEALVSHDLTEKEKVAVLPGTETPPRSSQSRDITSSSTALTPSTSSNPRGWAFGGMDISSLKGGWSYDGQSREKGKGKEREISTETAPRPVRSIPEQIVPHRIPATSSINLKSSYSWARPHIGLPSIPANFPSTRKGKERETAQRDSSSQNSSPTLVRTSRPNESQIEGEGHFSIPQEPQLDILHKTQKLESQKSNLKDSAPSRSWNMWNLGWGHQSELDSTERSVTATKPGKSLEPLLPTSLKKPVVSFKGETATSTTSPANTDHHHHHHHHHHQQHHHLRHNHHHQEVHNAEATKTAFRSDDILKENSDSQKIIEETKIPNVTLPNPDESSRQATWNEWGWAHFVDDKRSGQNFKSPLQETLPQEADIEAGLGAGGSPSGHESSMSAARRGKFGLGSWILPRLSAMSVDLPYGSLSRDVTQSGLKSPAEFVGTQREEQANIVPESAIGQTSAGSLDRPNLGHDSSSGPSEDLNQGSSLWAPENSRGGGLSRSRRAGVDVLAEDEEEEVFEATKQQERTVVGTSYSDFGSAVGIHQYLG